MNRCMPLLLGLVFACALASNARCEGAVVLTRSQAVAAAVVAASPGPITRLWCPASDYGFGPGFEGVLPAGTTVHADYADLLPQNDNTATLSQPAYLFFVDPDPIAGFTHPVKFLFVDATTSSPTIANGGVLIQSHELWPVIQRPSFAEEVLFGGDTRASFAPAGPGNPDGLVYGPPTGPLNPTASPPSMTLDASERLNHLLPPQGPDRGGGGPPPQHACGLIITGTGPGAADTWEAGVDGTGNQFKSSLNARGIDNSRIQDKRDASLTDVGDAVTALCALAPPCDKVFVYIGSHGGVDKIMIKGRMVPIKDLADKLKPLSKTRVCFLVCACYSGSFTDELRAAVPNSLIITSADGANVSWGGSIRKPDNTKKGDFVFFGWSFIDCWNTNDPAANTDGEPGINMAEAFLWATTGGRGTVKWNGNGQTYDPVGQQHPQKDCLPVKTERWQGPISGTWYVDIYRDTDCDGAYDQHDWSIDADCNGIAEFIYLEDDKNEDGKPERKVCYQYTNTGTPIMRVVFTDSNSDGRWDKIERENWNGSTYVLTATALPRVPVATANVIPPSGPASGGVPIQIQMGISWATPNLSVFVGSHVSSVQLVNPITISGISNGYTSSLQDVVVVDFTPSSPSFGFVQFQGSGFNYIRDVGLNSVDPPLVACNTPTMLTLSGVNFNPTSQVQINGTPVPTTFGDNNTLFAQAPGGLCNQTVSIGVFNGAPSSSLLGGLTFAAMLDSTPPSITPPSSITIAAGPDGLARTPGTFAATATDGSGSTRVLRDTVGALPLGIHTITFEAFDPSGNRSSASANVQVTPPCPGDINGDGRTNTADLTTLLGQFGQFGPNLSADLNHDGVVNTVDLTILLGGFGCGT